MRHRSSEGTLLTNASIEILQMFSLYYMTDKLLSLRALRRLGRKLGLMWHYSTMKRRFRKYCLRQNVTKSLFLTSAQRLARQSHALRMLSDPILYASTIFSDEKLFVVEQSGPKYVWSLDGAPRGSLVPTKKWQRRVMVWGAVGLQGQHRFYIVPSGADGTVDASVYLNVILRGVLPLLDENPGTMFQQDNARSHIAAGPIRILRATGSLLEPWPANSPDMSPVEFVWARMLGILNLVNNWDTRGNLEDVLYAVFVHVVTDQSFLTHIWERVLCNMEYIRDHAGEQN